MTPAERNQLARDHRANVATPRVVRALLGRLPPKRRAVFLDILRHELKLELQAARQDEMIEAEQCDAQ